MQSSRFTVAALAVALLGAGSHVETWSQAARLGTTSLAISTSVTTLSTAPGNERYRLAGSMRIVSAGVAPYVANPWSAIGVGADAHGILAGVTAVAITRASLAYLAGSPHADAIVEWMGCGANCSGASTIFTYDALRRRYAVARWAHQPDWDTTAYGSVVHLDAAHDAIATHQPSPFDDCHACLPGTVPVLYAIVGGTIADVSARHPARLRADAPQAWAAAMAIRSTDDDAAATRNAALFRYLADECRLNACAQAWRRVQGAVGGNDTKDALAQMRGGIMSGGYGSL